MHRIIAILLLLSLSFQCLVKLGVVTWYEANKSYVSRILCENQSKPQMKCHGKCYLKKQLAKTGKAEEHPENKSGHSSQPTIDFLVSSVITLDAASSSETSARNDSYSCILREGDPNSVFHPPALKV